MELTLTDEEQELLREILSWAYRDLRSEVVDADLPSYRRGLREREAHLKAVLDRIGGVLPLDA